MKRWLMSPKNHYEVCILCILSLYPLYPLTVSSVSSSHCSSILSRSFLDSCWTTATLKQSPRTLTEALQRSLKGTARSKQWKQRISATLHCILNVELNILHNTTCFYNFVSTSFTIRSRESRCSGLCQKYSLEILWLWSLLLLCWMLLLIHCRWNTEPSPSLRYTILYYTIIILFIFRYLSSSLPIKLVMLLCMMWHIWGWCSPTVE